MHSPTEDAASRRRSSVVTAALNQRKIGVLAMMSCVGAAAAPLMVVATLTPTAWAVTGFVGLPVVLLLLGVVLMLYAVGYTTMARYVTNAGAMYAHVTYGLGRSAGVGAGMVALLAYNALQVGLYGVFGAITSSFLGTAVGSILPWWMCALLAWLVVAVLGVLRIDLSGRVLTVILAGECAIMLVADVVMLSNPAGGEVSLSALSPAHLSSPALGAAIVVVATAFVGCEQPNIYAEEARNRRSVPIATYAALALIAGLYALSTWALTVTFGPDQIVAAATSQGENLLFNTLSRHLGSTAGDLARLLMITSIFAGLLAFHNTCSRYAFALGREGVLPSALGRTAPRSGAPKAGSLSQSALGLIVLLVYAALGLDPMLHLFFIFGTGGGLGVLTLFALTGVSIVLFFLRQREERPAPHEIVLPGIAALGLVIGAGLAVFKIDTLMGVPPDSPLTWAVPSTYLAIALLGMIWARVLRVRHPAAYTAIGGGRAPRRGTPADHTPSPKEPPR